MIESTVLHRGDRRGASRCFMAVFILVSLLGPAALHSQDQPAGADSLTVGRRWAVIVCVNDYDDAGIPDLRFCEADGQLLAGVLSEECGYNPRDVVMLVSGATSSSMRPTLANIRTELRFLARRAQADDVVLVYFSGHGYLDDNGRGYLLPEDCRRDNLEGSTLPTAELRECLADCPARGKLLVLDCCHAGGKGLQVDPTGEELGTVFRETPGLLTLASCRAGERSWEWEHKRHGLFSYYLAEGLRGEADTQYDGLVDSTELYSYVRGKVISTAQEIDAAQTPVQVVGPGEVPVFALAKVKPKVYFEDFSGTQPGMAPEDWKGRGLTVQELGGQRVLQARDLGQGFVDLPAQRITGDFFVECFFDTNGYVNKPRSFELSLFTKQGSPIVRVAVLDRYPNCDVTVNNRHLRAPRLNRKNRLYITRSGRGLSVQLNGEPVEATQISDADLPGLRLALGNNRDEYGRVDTSKFPTVYSIRVGPLAADGG